MAELKVGDKVKVNIKDCHNRIETIDEDIIGEVVYIHNFISRKILQIKVHNENLYGARGIGNIKLEMFEGGWWYADDAVLVKETHFPLYSEEEAVKLLTERGYEVKAPPEPLKGKVYIYNFPQLMGGKNSVHALTANEFAKNDWAAKPNVIAIVDWTEGQGI